MPRQASDPGYGNPLAPVGTEEWAKRWRLEFQSIAKDLPKTPERGRRYYEVGKEHRAWTLLTDQQGRPFPDFDAFCAHPQPWGLGMEPAKFRAYLEAEVGKRAADLETAPPPRQGERTDQQETSGHYVPKSEAEARKDKRLRAILRAPESIQALYREGLLTQTTAAKLGPKSPTPEQAGKVAEARQAIEAIDHKQPQREFRKRAAEVVGRILGSPVATPLDLLRRAWDKASTAEREEFIDWIGSEGGEL